MHPMLMVFLYTNSTGICQKQCRKIDNYARLWIKYLLYYDNNLVRTK